MKHDVKILKMYSHDIADMLWKVMLNIHNPYPMLLICACAFDLLGHQIFPFQVEKGGRVLFRKIFCFNSDQTHFLMNLYKQSNPPFSTRDKEIVDSLISKRSEYVRVQKPIMMKTV